MPKQINISELYIKAGSASELARQLGIYPAAVLQWGKVPASRVSAAERIVGVSRHEQRPEFFGDEAGALQEASRSFRMTTARTCSRGGFDPVGVVGATISTSSGRLGIESPSLLLCHQ
jgi:DNA-binding transcriptional regulator YdaS (Cro superfamily)